MSQNVRKPIENDPIKRPKISDDDDIYNNYETINNFDFDNSPFPPLTISCRCLWVRDIWPMSAALCPGRNRNYAAVQIQNKKRANENSIVRFVLLALKQRGNVVKHMRGREEEEGQQTTNSAGLTAGIYVATFSSISKTTNNDKKMPNVATFQ